MLDTVNKLNVVIINDFGNINGGAAKVATDTAIGLSNAGYNVHYFCAVGVVDKNLEAANLTSIIHLNQSELINADNKFKAMLSGIWNTEASLKMAELLHTLDPENTIVHVHGWTKSLSISPIIRCLRMGFPTVITLHDFFIYCPNGGFYNFPKNQICKKTPLSLGCILSNCDSRSYSFKLYRVMRSTLQRLLLSFYKKHINLIALSKLSYNVLNPYIKNFKATYFVENPIDTYKLPKVDVTNNTSCVFIGRLSLEKGVEVFCEAVNMLGIKDVIIAGEGDNKVELVSNYPNFTFTGWQSKAQIREILKGARILVFPSVWYETYGLVIQEAMSYGIPCIVSDCTAACELITDGVDGLIFRSKDSKQLSEQILSLLSNNEYTSSLSNAAYNKFWGLDHSLPCYTTNLKNVYHKILGSAYQNVS